MIIRTLFRLIFLLLFVDGRAQDSVLVTQKSHFIFDVNSGLIVSNAISNYQSGVYYSKYYSQTPGTQICYGFGGGAEFLWTRSVNLKPLVGLSYTLTHSDFREDYDIVPGVMHAPTRKKHVNWLYAFRAMDLTLGIRMSPTKRFHITLGLAYSYVFNGHVRKYGYYTEDGLSYPSGQPYQDSTNYNGNVDYQTARYLSWRVKLAYDFKIKNERLALFALFNWGIGYFLPYGQAGLQWYPFRKMQ